jgi:hypothetical protein
MVRNVCFDYDNACEFVFVRLWFERRVDYGTYPNFKLFVALNLEVISVEFRF